MLRDQCNVPVIPGRHCGAVRDRRRSDRQIPGEFRPRGAWMSPGKIAQRRDRVHSPEHARRIRIERQHAGPPPEMAGTRPAMTMLRRP